MRAHLTGMLVLLAIASFAPLCQAQVSGNTDTQAEIVTELIGAPALAADGTEIGEVADLLFDGEGRVRRVRIKAAAHLGFGTRTIEVPQGAFTVLRGAVVLDLPAEALQALPQATELETEK